MGAEVVLTDPKPLGEGDAMYVQHIQQKKSQIIGLKLYWDGLNHYMSTNNVKLLL